MAACPSVFLISRFYSVPLHLVRPPQTRRTLKSPPPTMCRFLPLSLKKRKACEREERKREKEKRDSLFHNLYIVRAAAKKLFICLLRTTPLGDRLGNSIPHCCRGGWIIRWALGPCLPGSQIRPLAPDLHAPTPDGMRLFLPVRRTMPVPHIHMCVHRREREIDGCYVVFPLLSCSRVRAM